MSDKGTYADHIGLGHKYKKKVKKKKDDEQEQGILKYFKKVIKEATS